MKEFYFTFGTDPAYPYGIDDYVLVRAGSYNEACEKFKAKHPNRPGSKFINCAFIYSRKEFDKFRDKYYKGIEPAETIE